MEDAQQSSSGFGARGLRNDHHVRTSRADGVLKSDSPNETADEWYLDSENLLLKMSKRKKYVRPFCPNLMFRLDNITSIPGSPTLWVCSICLSFILKQDAVKPHLKRCQINAEQNREAAIQRVKKYVSSLYTCDNCYQVFNREVDREQHIIDKHN